MRRHLPILSLLLALLTTAALSTPAQAAPPFRDQAQALQRALNDLQAAYTADLAAEQAKTAEAQTALEQARTEYAALQATVTATAAELEALRATIRELEARLNTQTPPPPQPTAILTPGSGWVGPMPVPSGTGPMAIARWDVVPWIDVREPLNVGVAAYAVGDIDRVEIAVDGGVPVIVRAPSLNPHTQVVEYWATLDPARFQADKLVELRAIAVPKAGTSRVLEPIRLTVDAPDGQPLPSVVRYVSPNGSDSAAGTQAAPMRSVFAAMRSIAAAQGGDAGGGRIVLMPGEYDITGSGSIVPTASRWLSIEPAPGQRGTAVLTGGKSYTRLLRVDADVIWHRGVIGSDGKRTNRGARFVPYADAGSSSAIAGQALWCDGMTFRGYGRVLQQQDGAIDFLIGRKWPAGVYVTDSVAQDGVNCWGSAGPLVRNVTARRYIADGLQNAEGLLANVTIDDVSREGTSAHGDCYQVTGGKALENTIFYGWKVSNVTSGQGLYFSNDTSSGGTTRTSVDGLAIIDCRIELGATANKAFVAQGVPFRNVVMRGNLFRGGSSFNSGYSWGSPSFSDVLVIDPQGQWPSAGALQAPPVGVTYR